MESDMESPNQNTKPDNKPRILFWPFIPPAPDHPGQIQCPYCGYYNTQKTYNDRFECRDCGRTFN